VGSSEGVNLSRWETGRIAFGTEGKVSEGLGKNAEEMRLMSKNRHINRLECQIASLAGEECGDGGDDDDLFGQRCLDSTFVTIATSRCSFRATAHFTGLVDKASCCTGRV
jgi:hypothetical protein